MALSLTYSLNVASRLASALHLLLPYLALYLSLSLSAKLNRTVQQCLFPLLVSAYLSTLVYDNCYQFNKLHCQSNSLPTELYTQRLQLLIIILAQLSTLRHNGRGSESCITRRMKLVKDTVTLTVTCSTSQSSIGNPSLVKRVLY